jgi:hypothetical protein
MPGGSGSRKFFPDLQNCRFTVSTIDDPHENPPTFAFLKILIYYKNI